MQPIEAVASTTLNVVSRVSGRLAGAGAFRLFHMPFARSKLRGVERELFGTATVEHLAVDSGRAVTYRWGDGTRPVLLVHGWQSRGSRLSEFVPGLLERGYSVITFDAPGHGDATGRSTTILDYRAIVTALHDRYGTFEGLVAHSLGVLGSFYALHHGVRAERIVTVSGVCDFDFLIEEFSSELRLRDQLTERLRDQVDRRLFPDVPSERTPFSVTHAVASVHAPLLVVHDEGDTRIDVSQGRRIAAAFGERAQLITTRDLGHRRILGDADVVRTVLDFVEHGPGAIGTARARTASAD
ncbi:alpha/beta hydrolase [Streptomyces sp. AC563]|uniref:alpha/beta hydrolase n=1 Tax=Streptomyces buecherae TaxID=2763006 RepID=UPI00164DE3A7|nr:alpha/beta hydrolase [Streptomyces buecherae]MBC3987496.1 alpha/beta hydrolase [Streptomyces buecherae]